VQSYIISLYDYVIKTVSLSLCVWDLKLNKDAWKDLSGQEQEDWVSHLVITVSQQRRLSNPRIISWNAGPHGYRNSRDEIWSLFVQGQPLICLQDLRIPPKLISAIKDELHAQFPHYWILISTVNKQGVTCDSSGEHYNFTTLTALDSYHFPSATSETLHPGRQLRRGKGLHRKRFGISSRRGY